MLVPACADQKSQQRRSTGPAPSHELSPSGAQPAGPGERPAGRSERSASPDPRASQPPAGRSLPRSGSEEAASAVRLAGPARPRANSASLLGLRLRVTPPVSGPAPPRSPAGSAAGVGLDRHGAFFAARGGAAASVDSDWRGALARPLLRLGGAARLSVVICAQAAARALRLAGPGCPAAARAAASRLQALQLGKGRGRKVGEAAGERCGGGRRVRDASLLPSPSRPRINLLHKSPPASQ